jgi:hypothetical protein
MKTNLFLLTVFILFKSLLFGQLIKPSIMIKPADDWMMLPYPDRPNVNFMKDYINQSNEVEKKPNYEEALIKYPNLNNVIGKIDAEMRKDNFETILLDNALKQLKQNAAEDEVRLSQEKKIKDPIEALRTAAGADIEFNVYWKVLKQGPRQRIESFRLQGVDSYTGKPMAYAEGSGEWASAYDVTEADLLKEAVQSKMDKFKNELMESFTRLISQGREIKIKVSIMKNWDKNFESELGGDELGYLIEDWITKNSKAPGTSKGGGKTKNIEFTGFKIALRNEQGIAQDPKRWSRPLKKYLNGLGVPSVEIIQIGLGSIEIFLGQSTDND